ncbi:hypothetical protein AAC387_Pa03g1365 [Persea americana]
MALRMQQTENVTQFAKRFWTIYSQIEGASDKVAVKSFQQAQLLSIELQKDLVRFPVVTMKALMAQANQFIKTEEDEARARENFSLCHEERPSKKEKRSSRRVELDRHRASLTSLAASVPTSGSGKKFKPEATTYKAVNTILKEPIYKLLNKIKSQPFFKWPQPMKGDRSTQDQNKDYIKEEGGDNCRCWRRDDDQDSGEPEGIINIIHLAPPPKGSNQARAEAKRASHQKQVMTAELEPTSKKAWTEWPKIWFLEKYLDGV